jgi:BirA family biotin operon repressor/biotin-[acetyl-CoA-carboxylase] ligase
VRGGAERVLEALRRAGDRHCSGASLSADLGVTRAQIWKHVEALRSRGYGIEGAPGDGYRLRALPDRLYPEEIRAGLATRWLGREIRHFEETDSTNRVAQDLARAGAPHGLAVIAEGQTAGRGRLGRAFFSPPHANLYVSFVLRPEVQLADAPTLILAAGLAVAESVVAVLGDPEPVEIKWPNDVLVRGRKTSGILMELSAEATRVGFLVLGIGVNLNVDPATFPEDFRRRATSLAAEVGHPLDRVAFTRGLFGTLESMLDRHTEGGFEALRADFGRFFRMAGRSVRVADPAGSETEGVAEGIAADGALLLRRAGGGLDRVLAGDVTIVKEELRP